MKIQESAFEKREGMVFAFEHYGLSSSVVMRSKNISPGAKCVHAYLMTYVNNKQMKEDKAKAWPSRKRMVEELGYSVNTLTKYIKELKDKDIIEVRQVRIEDEDGRQNFGHNIYTIKLFIPETI